MDGVGFGGSSVGTSVVVVVDGLLDKQKCTGLTSGDCNIVIVQRHLKNWPTFEFIGSGGSVMSVGRGRHIGKEDGQEDEKETMGHHRAILGECKVETNGERN